MQAVGGLVVHVHVPALQAFLVGHLYGCETRKRREKKKTKQDNKREASDA